MLMKIQSHCQSRLCEQRNCDSKLFENRLFLRFVAILKNEKDSKEFQGKVIKYLNKTILCLSICSIGFTTTPTHELHHKLLDVTYWHEALPPKPCGFVTDENFAIQPVGFVADKILVVLPGFYVSEGLERV